jgi:hypothetical protein
MQDLLRLGPSSLADGGANVYLTNDPTLLVDMVDIDPVPLGTALAGLETSTLMCTQKGYMPIPLLNRTLHYQPFLINQHAADTIMSPEHILNNKH